MSDNSYRPSDLLYKVEKLKPGKPPYLLLKHETLRTDIGVVKQSGRTLSEVQDILDSKLGTDAKFAYRVAPVMIGWTHCYQCKCSANEPQCDRRTTMTDDLLIGKYGLLKDDLTDV